MSLEEGEDGGFEQVDGYMTLMLRLMGQMCDGQHTEHQVRCDVMCVDVTCTSPMPVHVRSNKNMLFTNIVLDLELVGLHARAE